MEYEMYISIVGFGISNDADLIKIEFVSGTTTVEIIEFSQLFLESLCQY